MTSIERGRLDDVAEAMARAGAWWSIQPFLADRDANPQSTPQARAVRTEIAEGAVRAVEVGRGHGVNMAVGSDILFNPHGAASQGRQIATFARLMLPCRGAAAPQCRTEASPTPRRRTPARSTPRRRPSPRPNSAA